MVGDRVKLMPSNVTPEKIAAALQRAYPGVRFDSLTYELISSEHMRERRVFLAELGAESLTEAPLRDEVAALAEQVGTLVRRREPQVGAPVSLREAARRLHISKSRSLTPAIAAGTVRTVRVGGRTKVPADELQRLAREGLEPVAPKRRQRRKKGEQGAPVTESDVEAQVAAVLAIEQ